MKAKGRTIRRIAVLSGCLLLMAGASKPLYAFHPFEHFKKEGPKKAKRNPLPSVTQGAYLYTRACLSCHGPRGDGQGFYPMPAGPTAPALNHLDASRVAKDSLERMITRGGDGMPAWGQTMSSGQIRSVVLYVRSLNEQDGSLNKAAVRP